MTARSDLILPSRNEAAALPAVLASVPEMFDVIVVDNGSSDDTAAVAARLGAVVVDEPRAGYGAAVHAGVLAATHDVVAVMDADGTIRAAELIGFVERVESGDVDMAVGRRRPMARGVWPWHARAGNALLARWLRHRTGVPVRDLAPVRVCRREQLLSLDVRDRRFGYPVELLVKAQRARWRIEERDIGYHPRAAGTSSKVSGSLTGTVRALRDFAAVLR
ncbi:glycosyltransferase family 2 protein [Janibacter alittae]|uniref:Glycosyltransferase family 2 protein n=1 Tax=Janibacter alittae TaxID=3115209 RepID=A0ABZ2ML92_9MICO